MTGVGLVAGRHAEKSPATGPSLVGRPARWRKVKNGLAGALISGSFLLALVPLGWLLWTVLAKGLDAGTAFEILSIDIADVDVGKNIGAELQTDQAEADKRIAQAKAEERRALAVAMEQEYKAEAQSQRAKVIGAKAEIPLAIADAFRKGNLGVLDFQRYKNIQADTAMRQAIAGEGDGSPPAAKP